MRVRSLTLAALLALSACGTAQRALTYDTGWPDADVTVGNQRFQVWFHEQRRSVLVMRGDPQPLSQLLAENVTVYARDRTLGILWWGAAANAVLQPLGCHATEVTGADQMREIEYVCQSDVDVNAEVRTRRAEWRRGVAAPAPG
ncbi:MAG: hypothetical protein AB7Q23_00370 [Hyphomonadaceae bacterium]